MDAIVSEIGKKLQMGIGSTNESVTRRNNGHRQCRRIGVVSPKEIFQNASLQVPLWNHPSHDLDCCLALLPSTQEGSSAGFDASPPILKLKEIAALVHR